MLICTVVGFLTLQFVGLKGWLLYAVTEAETALGEKTGQLKLLYAYDLAIKRFPIIAKLIPLSLFNLLVSGSLKKLKKMIESKCQYV